MMQSHGYPPARRMTPTDSRAPKRPSQPGSTDYFPTFFQQSCPTCSRHLRVDVRQLGQQVSCPHCRSVFVARDGVRGHRQAGGPSALERAEQLLAWLDSDPPRRPVRA